MRGLIVLALAVISLASFTGRSAAEEVTLEYLGLDVTANLEIAQGKSLKDGAVLLVHDTQGHGRMEFMASLQDGLRDHGINSLAITLGLGIDKRRGHFRLRPGAGSPARGCHRRDRRVGALAER